MQIPYQEEIVNLQDKLDDIQVVHDRAMRSYPLHGPNVPRREELEELKFEKDDDMQRLIKGPPDNFKKEVKDKANRIVEAHKEDIIEKEFNDPIFKRINSLGHLRNIFN